VPILRLQNFQLGTTKALFKTEGNIFVSKNTAGANPTIASYNASAVKSYSATNSLVRFKNTNIFFYFEKPLYPTTIMLLYL
jgi:hypothetical protein